MTKEELAAEYLKKWLNGDIYHSASHSPSNCFYDGFIAGYSAAESEIRELREKLEYTENKLGTMLAIDEMLYLRGFSKPTDWSVSNARWKVIVKLQSLAREALSKIRGGDK